jgi:hypothetical protein
MEEWGNGRANAYYEANLPSHIVKPKEGDPVRSIEKFIRDKYEFKRYIASSVPDKVANSASASVASNGTASGKVTPALPAQQKGKFVYDNEDAQNATAQPAAQALPPRRPEPVAAPAPVAAKPAARDVDLLNFMDDPVTPVTPASAPAASASDNVFGFSASQTASQNGQPQFGSTFSNFGSSAPTSAPSTASSFSNFSGFDNFGGNATDSLTNPFPPQGGAAAPPAKPQASADSILSLFTPPAPAQPAYGMHPGMMGMPGQYAQQPGMYPGAPAAGGYYPQPAAQQGYYPQQAPAQSYSPYPGQPTQQPYTHSPYGQPQAQQPAYAHSPYGGAPYGQAPGYAQPQAAGFPPQQPPQQQQAFADLNAWR